MTFLVYSYIRPISGPKSNMSGTLEPAGFRIYLIHGCECEEGRAWMYRQADSKEPGSCVCINSVDTPITSLG